MAEVLTIRPSRLERGLHGDQWQRVVYGLVAAGFEVSLDTTPDIEERGGLPGTPEFPIAAYIVWTAVGEPATEAVRDTVMERVREILVKHLERPAGKPRVVVLVDERHRPIADIELPADDE